MTALDWQLQAACAGHDPELWFARTLAEMGEAKTICKSCPVKDQCETFSAPEQWGIWAAIDRQEAQVEAAAERKRLEREQKAAQLARDAELKRARHHRRQAERKAAEAAYQAGDRSPHVVKIHAQYEAFKEQKRRNSTERRKQLRADLDRYNSGARDNKAVHAFNMAEKKRAADIASVGRVRNSNKETAA